MFTTKVGVMAIAGILAISSTTFTETTPREVSIVMPAENLTENSLVGESTVSGNEVLEEKGPLVVIDAGHQQRANTKKEPVGPGAKQMKMKVTGGAVGCRTKQCEYVLNLSVAQKLEEILTDRGYEVLMIRTGHDVDISNVERAQMANEANADAFIRIHANGCEDSRVNGICTICQTSRNPYNSALYEESRRLSDCVLQGCLDATGAKSKRVWETDTMTGINWCEVPVTILEMGFLSNPREDRLMATEEYQRMMAEGIANGLDVFFDRDEKEE